MRSGNPVLGDKTFEDYYGSYPAGQAMTIQGTVNNTFIMLALVAFSAFFAWMNLAATALWIMPAAIGGFAVAILTVFKKEWSPLTAPIYAVLEGFVLGGISAFMEEAFPGIVMQAIALTFGILFALLAAYKSGYIKVTENFKLGVVAATGGIALYYMITFILSFFSIRMPLIYDTGFYGILFSLFVVIIAALNLVLDFDFIEKGAEHGAPKYMEWYGAFGLIVTLVWLYLEILRLLAKSRRR